jgi:putative peptidoglycan lipid II flippase
MAGLLLCATPIFTLLFMGGAFDYAKAVKSAEALYFYSWGLTFVALVRVMVPAFYALKDTRTPVLTAFAAFLINFGFSLILMGPLLHGGLALATSLSAFFNMLMLAYYLRKKIGPIGGKKIAFAGLRILLATLPMSLVVSLCIQTIDWSSQGQKLLKGGVLTLAVCAGIFVFLIFAHFFRCEETARVSEIIRRKLRR